MLHNDVEIDSHIPTCYNYRSSAVGHTSNAYRAMLALLTAVEEFNWSHNNAVESIVIPGLCTGVGDMEPEDAALQMARAYEQWIQSNELDEDRGMERETETV